MCLCFIQPCRSVKQSQGDHKTMHFLEEINTPATSLSCQSDSKQLCKQQQWWSSSVLVSFQIPAKICIHLILIGLCWACPWFLLVLLLISSKSFAFHKSAAMLGSYWKGCAESLPFSAAIESARYCLKALFSPLPPKVFERRIIPSLKWLIMDVSPEVLFLTEIRTE